MCALARSGRHARTAAPGLRALDSLRNGVCASRGRDDRHREAPGAFREALSRSGCARPGAAPSRRLHNGQITLHPPPHAARTSARSRQPLCSCLHAVMMAWALLHPPQPQRPAMLQPLIGLGYTGLDIPPASGGTLPASTSGHQDMTSQASTDILLEMLLLPISPTFSIFCRAQAAMCSAFMITGYLP